MKSIVGWAIRNAPGMNTLMIAVLLSGMAGLFLLRREQFPEFELEVVLVRVPYPGASPEEVEEGICLKIEEAVRSISGIKKQTSVAAEGMGSVVLELNAQSDVQRILSEIRSEVDRIPSFPELAEDAEVKQITMRRAAIRVGIIGPESQDIDAEIKLRSVAESVRSDLMQLPSVSQPNLIAARDYQIDIEISEQTLRKYGLSLQQVARIVRRENLELPGGRLKTDAQQVLLRGKAKRTTGHAIATIPLITQPDGLVLTVGDLGSVHDGFIDTATISVIDGAPGIGIAINRTADEDLLQIVAEVREYVGTRAMPAGYRLVVWGDEAINVRGRMDLLARNGLQGLVLVFLVLAVFLDLRLAFWVALGIPVSILGACAILLGAGHTLNMLSMFAFVMSLGIVVDDAIVIGENIYAHRQQGKRFVTAAIDGTVEVFPSVLASVTTTIIAFIPLMYVTGVMGKFVGVLPIAVIAMLVISLLESMAVLPCHLAHHDNLFLTIAGHVLYPLKPLAWLCHRLNRGTQRLLNSVIDRAYLPGLRWSLRNPALVVSLALAMLLLAFGFIQAGITPFIIFPRIDTNTIEARVVFPDGTPASVTRKATEDIERAMRRVDEKYKSQGTPLVSLTHRTVGDLASGAIAGARQRTSGSHVGLVQVELVDTSRRSMKSGQIAAEWRRAAGVFPGVESISFASARRGPGGTPIEFKLLAPTDRVDELEAAVELAKARLEKFQGVFDVADDSNPGKWEFRMTIRNDAKAMGVPLAELAGTVRASYYGEEVMRLQRGRHEVKLMVRYPASDRRSLADFQNIRVRSGDGVERPLTELADITVARGLSEINRVDQLRSITVTADIDETIGNASETVAALQASFMPVLLNDHPHVTVRWEGQQETTVESMESLFRGFAVAMLVMFTLLTIQFRSYVQPLIVMAIIPFGAIGAIVGHAVMGLPFTLFSIFGMIALTGVVVNDSIVLIDFVNRRVRAGLPIDEAILDAGRRRFRPVLLTSITTVAGLTPILLETSLQAQLLIPMATSLSFGLVLATLLVLFLLPTFYYIYATLGQRTGLLTVGEPLAAANAKSV